MDVQYIKLLNTLRFARDIEGKRDLLLLRDYYEDQLKDVRNVRYLIDPFVKCIRTDDEKLLAELTRKHYIEEPHFPIETEGHIIDLVSKDYEHLLDDYVQLSRKKKGDYVVYMRVHRETGHFYIGHSSKTANSRKHAEDYYVRGNIRSWSKNNNITLVHEFVRELILDDKSPDECLITTNLYSLDDKHYAEILENFIILVISLNKIPNMRPEKMLNVQHRFNERLFVYQDIRGDYFTYVNDYPKFYRIKMKDQNLVSTKHLDEISETS